MLHNTGLPKPCRTMPYFAVQGGAIKLYKSLVCPLDGYELLLFSLSGADGKTFPLCPFCYNSPPFEGVAKVRDKRWLGGERRGAQAMIGLQGADREGCVGELQCRAC